jgi:acetyltransferase-like isoleucine patch superfamily enzyme
LSDLSSCLQREFACLRQQNHRYVFANSWHFSRFPNAIFAHLIPDDCVESAAMVCKEAERSPTIGAAIQVKQIHATADVSPLASIGEGTKIWHQVQIREGVKVGKNCILGKGAYLDFDVVVGDNVKVQNGAFLYHGLTIEDGVFVGPGVIFTNDKAPRAITPDGQLKGDDDWEVGRTIVRHGASIGAGAILLPGVEVGRFAMVGAGAVVADDVRDFSVVVGIPARHVGWVCMCGQRLMHAEDPARSTCTFCKRAYVLKGAGADATCELAE